MSVRGAVAVAALLVSISHPAHAHPEGPSGCGTQAPLTVQCTTGWHSYDEAHDEAAINVTAYTGTVQSALHFFDGTRALECNFIAGVQDRCAWHGAPPAPGTMVYHTCTSFLVTYAHGGVGEFGCLLS